MPLTNMEPGNRRNKDSLKCLSRNKQINYRVNENL